uniref:NAD-dependent epimerase/dehydratase domain-containing protein n=1 Tax=Manihot esculenta TaxID=3983 RepID=A0A2C9VHE8_MANES
MEEQLMMERSREKMMINGERKMVVCVTGASGYITSWLVKLLLQKGYIIKATVQTQKTDHLVALDGAKERLHLFKANLLEERSFDAVVDGCEAVFHTASPVTFSVTHPQTEIIDPAVKGTLNVLKSCTKVQSIKRVIITSSLATMVFSGKPMTPDMVVDETWYSNPEFCRTLKYWYLLAKTLAEEAAWKFAKENSIDLVTLNPGYVIGPLLQPTLNESVEMILNLVNGAKTYSAAYYRSIDVRDVAVAHVQALEIPSASGRFCLVANTLHFSELLKIIHQLYPTLRLPEECDGDDMALPQYIVSQEKAKTLGLSFIPLELTLRDTFESLKAKGFLSI